MTYMEIDKQKMWDDVDSLMRRKSLSATRQARQILRDWMLAHPDDIASADAGEELAMMEEALEIIAREKSAGPVAV